ncbi:MAG: LD-carboxypeptidase [Candidatus Kapaibacterium sp.]
MQRRDIFKTLAAGMALGAALPGKLFSQTDRTFPRHPKKLGPGDTVGVIAPGTAVSDPDDLASAEEALGYFGLRMRLAPHVERGSGYKTRSPRERASDLEEMFEDPAIDAVFAIRGGYGSVQILDLIDYSIIDKNPKIFLGYSDITALHLAIQRNCSLVTFHGPMLLAPFTRFTMQSFEQALFQTEAPRELRNPEAASGFRQKYPVRTVASGSAKGRTAGGNLSIISALMGTPYEIETDGKILLIEDIGESPYRIDRMLTQLRLSGKLGRAAGIVFGLCKDCDPGLSQMYTWDSTLGEVLDNLLGDIGIPVLSGLTFGHTDDQMTIPIGVEAALDADSGVLTLLESGVSE